MENQNINLIENENKSNKSKLLTWVATILLGALVGVGAFLTSISPRYQKSSAYTEDESSYSFTITADELNNTNFSNLGPILHSNNDDYSDFWRNVTISYNESSYSLVNVDSKFFTFAGSGSGMVTFCFADYLTYSTPYHFYFYENWSGGPTPFDSSITIYFNSVSYPLVKNAIEQDLYVPKSITLTASELNNNYYEYLANQINLDEPNFDNSYIVYNGVQLSFDDFDSNVRIYYISDSNSIAFYLDADNDSYARFVLYDFEGVELPFSDSITIYSDYIVDNLYAPNSPSTWLDDIIALLTGGIVGLSGGVGSGVSNLASNIFISNNALSVFGGMIVVFAAISLAIGLCRFVMNFLTSLGAKK